jgi:fatty acid desaturase
MTTAESTPDLSDDPFDVWFAPAIDQSVLRGLMRRTNTHALLFLGVWIVLCVATGYAVVSSRHTGWVLPAMVMYGSVLCFAYAVSHECAHGTAFRTRWLNEAVFSITSLIFIEEPLYRRYAHAGHHTHTWFNALDPQKPYGNPLTLMRYLSNTLGLTFYVDAARQLMRHSAGRFTKTEREYIPPSEIHKVSFNSRVMAACYLALLVYGIALQSPWPFLLYFIPRFLGGCIVTLYVNTQHMCMAEDIYDHRLTTRSINCSLPERLLYWNMNYHIEHHLYPAVPFHALPALNQRIKDQLPPPLSSVVAANVDILRAVSRQRKEPQFNLSRAD